MDVFQRIYWVFLVLGTLVSIVVIGYMLQKAYRYREKGGEDEYDRPQLGEMPQGGGGGKKLFLSFALSTIIVVTLIAWTYGTLLYVEQGAAQEPPGDAEPIEVHVVGYQFGWEFTYTNVPDHQDGLTVNNELVVPEDRMIRLTVTSRDVFHNFAIREFRVKADAIPGQVTDSWFVAEETGEYDAVCYELCGTGHSYMVGTVEVTDEGSFEEWYSDQESEIEEGNETDGEGNGEHSEDGH